MGMKHGVTDFRVRRPKIAIAGAALAIVCSVLSVVWLSQGLTTILGTGYKFSERQMFFGSTFLVIFVACCVMVFVGGILILRQNYRVGGVVALIFSIFLVTSAGKGNPLIWFVAMFGIIGGILSIISREKIPERVLEAAKQHRQVSIKEVATETGKTELDMEQAIVKLRSKGQPIRFDLKTRKVIYDG